MRNVAFAFAVLVLSACSQGTTVQEEKEDTGQIGASSGPNPNFNGEAAGDAFDDPIPSEQGRGVDPDASTQDGATPQQPGTAQGNSGDD